jgi:hypothetical protein
VAWTRLDEFVSEEETLAVWTLGFFLAAFLLLRRKQQLKEVRGAIRMGLEEMRD